MSDNGHSTDRTEQDAYRLIENIILASDSLNDALYKANRYQAVEYEHLKEDSLQELRDVRDLIDEILEREVQPGKDQEEN